MKKISLFFLLLLFYSFINAMPGRLLLIGGGTERSGLEGWNGKAFQWAVEQSENKKVAFITYSSSSATSWMPDHFKSDWGASEAKNIVISTKDQADDQATYDEIMKYDVIYFKGGDQAQYYSLYNNTKTEQAILDKFNEGGVICGTSAGLAILGGVDFTAENGTVYPKECLQNWNNEYVKLADDFISPLFPGYIFDTHFVQRGRFARLISFMANWQFTKGEKIVGIGIDDLTAMAIDTNGIGTVYGTGCANIYKLYEEAPFQELGKHFVIDSISVNQLLQGCSIDFETWEITGFNDVSEPQVKTESGDYTIFLSGSDNLVKNESLLNKFANNSGSTDDPVIILTGSDKELAISYKDKLNSLGVNSVEVYSISEAENNFSLSDDFSSSPKYLFVDNNYGDFINFINNSDVGQQLDERIRKSDAVSAFIGDNSRFAGKTVISDYTISGANYYAEMEYKPGIALLNTTSIMPYTYLNSDYYENTVASIPYSMVTKDLAYGIWLTSENFVKYTREGDKIVLKPFGTLPVMILRNRGTESGVSEQTSSGSNGDPRQVAGFKQMDLSVIEPGLVFELGKVSDTTDNPVAITDLHFSDIVLFNYSERFVVEWNKTNFKLQVIDLRGRILKSKGISKNRTTVLTSAFKPGLYIIRLEDMDTGKVETRKIWID